MHSKLSFQDCHRFSVILSSTKAHFVCKSSNKLETSRCFTTASSCCVRVSTNCNEKLSSQTTKTTFLFFLKFANMKTFLPHSTAASTLENVNFVLEHLTKSSLPLLPELSHNSLTTATLPPFSFVSARKIPISARERGVRKGG